MALSPPSLRQPGPAAYAALFVVVLPLALVAWARGASRLIALPAPSLPVPGTLTALGGLALILSGMWALARHGRGLPMNAFPPPLLIMRGPYRYLRHPIYVGFALVCFGAALAAGSAGGLYLVAPAVTLGMVALTLGYENHDLVRRFGDAAQTPVRLALPPDGAQPPTGWQRCAVVVLVLVPWALAWEGVFLLGIPRDAVAGYLPFEHAWPVLPATYPIYVSVYPMALLTPFLAPTRSSLRELAGSVSLATAVVTFIYLLVPVTAPPRPIVDGGLLGSLLAHERQLGHTVCAFPSFHVIWAFLAIRVWQARFPRVRLTLTAWPVAISLTCLSTGMHAVADVVFALALVPLFRGRRRVWSALRAGAERVANSWCERQWGGVRLLGYAVYPAAAAFVGVSVAGILAGPAERGGILVVGVCTLVGAGLWGQLLKGGSGLSRPFGYFGGLVGTVAGLALAGACGWRVELLGTALAVAAPFIQAIGRLRCLVQGCCHGAPAPEGCGIHYRAPQSRVVALAGLGGRSVYPTPLYSMLANFPLGLGLLRLWTLGAPQALIVGVYLLGAGLSRFVEESYRGEPHTPLVGGLRFYQWTAVGLVLAGALVTALAPAQPAPPPDASGALTLLTMAAGLGLLYGAFMGVDFPRSRRRFARLAG